jgi:hypothetical protein
LEQIATSIRLRLIGWRKIMNDNSKLDHRELTDTELDGVSGGLGIQKQLDAASAKLGDGGGGGGGNAGPAIAAWNTLLHQYGAA